jgi:hypothetical protein
MKALEGDTKALTQLVIPSHWGGRVQIEVSIDFLIAWSFTVGANAIYNRFSDEFVINMDATGEPGLGLGGGFSSTGGPLLGWGSSDVDDVISGDSLALSLTGANGFAASIALLIPLEEEFQPHIDPISGQIPVTFYLGTGAGGLYGGCGAGISRPISIMGIPIKLDLSNFLP